MSTYTRKLGINRGKPRLWLEGKILLDNGFNKGDNWSLDLINNGFIIKLASEGTRKIAGTPERPIIDINATSILSVIKAPEVTIKVLNKGVLLVVGSNEQ